VGRKRKAGTEVKEKRKDIPGPLPAARLHTVLSRVKGP
jgi:hypothetical protein